MIKADPKSAEIIRPILRGRDIKRYGYDFADLWLINTHNGIREKGIKPVNVNNYPAIKKHLDNYWDEIEHRADQGDTPYNLRNCAYIEDFYRQKIVWGNLNLTAAFSFAPEGIFINAPCPLIVPASNYLLAILNSRLADYYIRKLGITRNGGYFEYKPMFIEKLPVPFPNNGINKKIDEMLQIKKYDEIDKIIYDLYNLTEIEIEFINSQ